MPVQSIRRLKREPLLHVTVQQSLRSFIEENQLKAGAPLPSEAELAERLAVSRNSVREAVKALESVGVLESRRGVGVFVREFSFDPLLDNLAYGLGSSLKQIGEVLEIRQTLEMGLIKLALSKMTQKDIDELRAVVNRMEAKAKQGKLFPDEDREFHTLLMKTHGNTVLLQLLDVFWLAFHKVSDFVNLDQVDPMSVWKDHDDIMRAIEEKDHAAVLDRLSKHYVGLENVVNESD